MRIQIGIPCAVMITQFYCRYEPIVHTAILTYYRKISYICQFYPRYWCLLQVFTGLYRCTQSVKGYITSISRVVYIRIRPSSDLWGHWVFQTKQSRDLASTVFGSGRCRVLVIMSSFSKVRKLLSGTWEDEARGLCTLADDSSALTHSKPRRHTSPNPDDKAWSLSDFRILQQLQKPILIISYDRLNVQYKLSFGSQGAITTAEQL